MSFITEAFTGTDDTELNSYSTSWVRHTNASETSRNIRIKGNRAEGYGTTGRSAYYNSTTPSDPDYTVSTDIYIANSGIDVVGVYGRMDSSAYTGYMAQVVSTGLGTNFDIYLYRVNSGSATQLGSTATATVSVGNSYTLKLSMNSDVIKVYLDGVEKISTTDGTPITSAGYAGLRIGATSSGTNPSQLRADNFDATYISSDVSISCSLGTAAASGYQANVNGEIVIPCALGSAAASGYQATITEGSGVEIACALGTAAASGYQAMVDAGITIACALGSATASGYAATVAGGNATISFRLKNNTATALTSETGITAFVYDFGGTLKHTETGISLDGSADGSFTDTTFNAGTYYAVFFMEESGTAVGSRRIQAI